MSEIVSFEKELFDNVELVYQRLTRGRHDLKKLKTYMEQRGEMARSWVKSMKKASEASDLEDSSSIANVWKEIRDTGLSQMKQQEAFASGCHDIAVALETQIVEIKKSKTTLHATYTKLVADVKKKQQLHDKAKEVYYEAVRQSEVAVMNRDSAVEQRLPDKQIQKAEARAKQCLKEVESLHSAYQKSVTTLQEAQQTHDVTVVDLLQQFEKLERNRLKIFLEQLDRFASQHDQLKANIDLITASLHQQVAAVDLAADVNNFIKTNASGKPPAPHVEYMPCKSSIIDHATDIKATNSGSVPVQATSFTTPTSSSSSQPPAAGISGSSDDVAPSSSAAAAAATSVTPSIAAAVAPAPSSLETVGTAVGLFDFDQNEPDDLPFKAGDVINLLSCPDAEEWWQGEKDGKVGIFPKAYVQRQGDASVAAPSHSVAAPAPAAAPVSSSNPFGDDGVEGGEGVAPGASHPPASAAVAAAAPSGAEGGAEAEAGAEVPKLMNAECEALFDFEGQDEDELTFKLGQTLIITGELNGWYLGRVEGTEKIGIFPSNYVKMR